MASRCLRDSLLPCDFQPKPKQFGTGSEGLIEGQSRDRCEAEVHSELGGFFSLIRSTAAEVKVDSVTRDIQVEADGLSQARTGGVR